MNKFIFDLQRFNPEVGDTQVTNIKDCETFTVGGKNYILTRGKLFLIEGDNPTKYFTGSMETQNYNTQNETRSVKVSDLVDENFVTCPYVKADNKIFKVDSTDEKYFFSSDNKFLAEGRLDGYEYKISAHSDYDLSEYTFEVGEIFNKNNSDAKSFYFDRTSLKENTHTTIKTTAGKFYLQSTNFSAKTPLEIVVGSKFIYALKTESETTLSVNREGLYLYVYKDNNSNPKTFSVSVNSKNSAEVDITFKDKEITKITGLDAGEIVNIDVQENGDGTDVTARNFYYFNGENLFIGEYEKNGDAWQIKDGMKVYKNYSSEKKCSRHSKFD